MIIHNPILTGSLVFNGTNLNGVTMGFATFMADGSTSNSTNSYIVQNGWNVSTSATNAGLFTITFTNGGGATMSNVNYRVIKINRSGG